jgi:hypothetical protein
VSRALKEIVVTQNCSAVVIYSSHSLEQHKNCTSRSRLRHHRVVHDHAYVAGFSDCFAQRHEATLDIFLLLQQLTKPVRRGGNLLGGQASWHDELYLDNQVAPEMVHLYLLYMVTLSN